MEAKLPDARPLINVCGCFGFVPDLTHCHANPGNAPLVVVQLLDDECPEDFVKVLLYLSVLSFRGSSCGAMLRDAGYLKRDELQRLYIAKATDVVSAYGFPVVVGERLDPDIHFKHTEGVAKTGQINYVERVTRESKFYDPEKKKNLLMKAMLPDARPLINVCGRFGFVPDLTHYDVNPGNGPLVVVQLLDDECPEDFINLSVLSFQRILLWCNYSWVEIGCCVQHRVLWQPISCCLFNSFDSIALLFGGLGRLRDACYWKRDEFLCIYIAKATGIVAAYGFPEGCQRVPSAVTLTPALDCLSNLNHMKDRTSSSGHICAPGYGQKANPGNAPLVVVQLLDDECPEDFVKVLLYLSVLSFQRILLWSNYYWVEISYCVQHCVLWHPISCCLFNSFDSIALLFGCLGRLRDAGYLKRDELQRLYIAKATDVVSAYGFPVVVGERKKKRKKKVNVVVQIVVQAAKEYPQPLGVDACIRLFEQFKSYEGLYFFLGGYLSSRLDPDIHFKHTEGVAKTGQINYVERVTRESKFYDPEKKKNLLMKAMLPDARPLINVCGRFGFVPDLTHYDVNPGNGPLVVVQLLDDECPEDFVKVLLYLSVLSFQRILLWSNYYWVEISYCVQHCVLWHPISCCLFNSFDSIALLFGCLGRLRDAGYLKRDELQRLYIAKATDVVSAYGFPVVVGERLDPDIHFKHTEGVAKTGQINYVERVTRESKFYDPEEKEFAHESYATGCQASDKCLWPFWFCSRSYPLRCMPTTCFDILKDMAKM
ncbi:hypothetical protein H6P81_021741 [Aristolochia fimbriata]|uniref:Uncharacterized protein n=1 Tax=Aristolochia fimbriata TaxID=158543 RepID=A0AAV7DSU8_ARIFI|nr:hypothetical protein H6P81_021741 [Aristolochia fimbriata]